MEPNPPGERVPHVDLSIGSDAEIVDAVELVSLRSVGKVDVILSFEDFYREQRAPIARALALTVRDTQLASEAVDEAMARAYQRWSRVQSLDNPGGWVYRVGLNWSRSVLRRALRPAPIWLTAADIATGGSGLDPVIDHALAELSVEQRAVVVCRLLIGYSGAQTASALGLRPGTVKSRLARATARLQSLLSSLDPANKDDNE